MGSGNANHSRGVDRSEVEKINAEDLQVTRYRIDDNANTKKLRIVYYDKKGEVLGWTVLTSDEAYNFSADILRKYDIIEGLDKPNE